MRVLIKCLILIQLILLFFLFNTPESLAAVTTTNEYYNTTNAADSAYIVGTCNGQCSAKPYCWNNATVQPGIATSCGDSCDGGNTWSRYQYYRCAQKDATGETCVAQFVYFTNECSTADKYNNAYPSAVPPGDLTMLRAGSCTCGAQELYKTCCNGTTAVGTYNAGGNPSFPDGGCSFTTLPCGTDPSIYAAMGYPYTGVACGAPACAATAGPTPTPTTSITCPGQTAPVCANGASPTCPNGYIYGSDSAGNKVCIDRSTGLPNCNVKPSCPSGCPNTGGWTGQQCNGPSSPNLAQACATDTTTCNKCSSAVCTLYDSGSNLYCYYNNTSACYIDSIFCKGFGNCGVCIQGSTKIDCSAPNVCTAP